MAIGKVGKVGLQVGGALLGALDNAYLGIGDLVKKVTDAAEQSVADLEDLVKFDFKPAFKTRVISVPAAFRGFNELWTELRDSLKSKINEVLQSVKTLQDSLANPTLDPEAGAVAGAFQRLQNFHTFLVLFGDNIAKALSLTSELDMIKKRLEVLDDLFLSQRNSEVKADSQPPRKRRRIKSSGEAPIDISIG